MGEHWLESAERYAIQNTAMGRPVREGIASVSIVGRKDGTGTKPLTVGNGSCFNVFVVFRLIEPEKLATALLKGRR